MSYRRPVAVPRTLEGCDLVEEYFDDLEGVKSYHRLMVQCPLADCEHFHAAKPCQKRRGLSGRLTRHFGDMESVGYLVLWIRNAADYASQPEHVRGFKESFAQDIKDYLISEGHLAPG